MSRNTVARLLMLQEPPRYAREGRASILDPYKGEIAALLDEDAKAPATVILERLRRLGYRGGITILKDHLACVRPSFLAARIFQRTSYLPGEICQIDWWDPGTFVPVGKGRTREVHGLVATLPHSAAHSVVFSFSKTMTDYLHCLLGCLVRLGGVPEKIVSDNDPCIVHHRQDRRAVIHDEVAALYGVLGCLGVVLDPGHPERKGQVERTNGYHEGSFMSLRSFEGIGDLQSQSDDWTENIAWGRHHRRVGSKVADALAVERTYLKALPARLPDVTRHLEARVMKDAFVRVAGVDYSVPPGLAGRRSRSGSRRMRSSFTSKEQRSPATEEASSRPMSCCLPLMRGRYAWPGRPGRTWMPATWTWHRSTCRATTVCWRLRGRGQITDQILETA